MKAGWKKLPLAEVCTLFTDGDWIETKDQSPEGIRLVQTGNVGVGEFKDRRDKARFISNETFDRLKCKEIYQGDCLVSRLPDPVGRSCIIPATGERMITAVDCTVLRFDTSSLIPEFFNYYSQSALYLCDVEAHCTGATRNRISRKNLGKVTLPLPPLPEQKRIVAILDEAFAGIATAVANTEKNLANARELFEGYLNRVFSEQSEEWISKRLEDVVASTCSLSYGIVQPGKEFPDGLPVVRPTDLTSKVIHLAGLKRIDPSLARTYKRTVLLGDELLLCVRGSTGALSVASHELKGSNVTRGIVPIRFEPSIIGQEFAYYQLSSKRIQDQIKANTYGTALMQINIRDLRKITVLVPPIEIQHTLVRKFDGLADETTRLESIYHQKLTALAELKQSLLQKAFSGELTAEAEPIMEEVVA